ncbi:replication-relaxation family protein [Halobacillus shinanisalinarum]|uniref:Replication-relaxation family protein n=1 Tax=Halobacillus shinanisalinarum TaxID=2932258 RepID=A0ABY4GZ01_9BACI|nr:replication-relaxation family protein [Halobacillus shinanisalinarum]UOQ93430.1 replication-relaxation family protein [Halobacillus shinanisalinarum]
MTRSQLQTIHDLKGVRNTNRFLQSMGDYLSCYRHGLENVYYLNKAGRDQIGSDVIRKKTLQVQHFLLRNQLWIYLKRPKTWENEVKIKAAADLSIICDAKFERKGMPIFVEADVSQPMAVNKKKIDKYRKIQEVTGVDFYLLWVTEIEGRKPRLEALMNGMKGHVYTLNEIK